MINNRQNGRRRGRGGGGPQVRGPNNGNDRGNRIDNRARGNAVQLHEKYRNLARDAQTQGDRVMTEYYLQFADHYFRVLSESRSRFDEQNQNQQRRPRYDNEDFDGESDEGEAIDDGNEPDMREPRQQDPSYRRDRDDRGQQDRGQQDRIQQDRGNRRDRDDRLQRTDYREPVAAAPGSDEAPIQQVAVQPDEVEVVRPRRGRPPRRKPETEDAPERIEVDRLPPSFSVSDPDSGETANGGSNDEEPAPRRRRARRPGSPEDNVAA